MDTRNLYVPDKSSIYKIVSYAVEEGSSVRKGQVLAEYKIINDQDATSYTIRSPSDGVVKSLIAGKDVATDGSEVVLTLEETCDHSIQVRGVCAICAIDLHKLIDSQKVNISLTYDSLGVTVSPDVAAKFDKETVTRLKDHKKLALILDLDQTLIHTTTDPLIFHNCSSKLQDKSELFQFQLSHQPIMYYVKLRQVFNLSRLRSYYYLTHPVTRPGVRKFLKTMASLYEIHVYTMGTRDYAIKISSILDPDGSLFNHRILTREESGSFMFKTVSRIFPCDQSMVVVLDDRSDIWKWSQNLYQVVPYEFFRGAIDMNATVHCHYFDTQQHGDERQQRGEEQQHTEEQQDKSTRVINPHSGGDFPNVRNEDGVRDTAEINMGSNNDIQLQYNDADNELEIISLTLVDIHTSYYSLADSNNPSEPPPNTCSIMSAMKSRVLDGVKIVFSGIAPVGSSVANSDLWIGALIFGAKCAYEIDPSVTHVVSVRNDSMKAIKSRYYDGMYLVRMEWLVHSIGRWKRQDESMYLHPELVLPSLGFGKDSLITLNDDGHDSEGVETLKDFVDIVETPKDFVDIVKTEKFESHIPREEWDKMNAEVEEVLCEQASSECSEGNVTDVSHDLHGTFAERCSHDDTSDYVNFNGTAEGERLPKYRKVSKSLSSSSLASQQHNEDAWKEFNDVLFENFANETE